MHLVFPNTAQRNGKSEIEEKVVDGSDMYFMTLRIQRTLIKKKNKEVAWKLK